MNERLKKLRKILNLNQKEFAKNLGITDSGLSRLESGKRNLTEQMIILICREFNVNRKWLVDGIEPIFTNLPTTVIDELALQFNLNDDEKEIIFNFCNLKKEERKAILKFIKNL